MRRKHRIESYGASINDVKKYRSFTFTFLLKKTSEFLNQAKISFR